MPTDAWILEPATPGDAGALAALRDEAAGWLVERGYVQWVPGEFDADRFARSIEQNEVHVVRDNPADARAQEAAHRRPRHELAAAKLSTDDRERGKLQIVATVTVTNDDELIWAGRHRPDAAYVHRLIVARRRAGQGLGASILREVERRARDAGRRALRLDCVELNRDLAAYYERHGFRTVGRRDYPPRLGFHPSLLMEKTIED